MIGWKPFCSLPFTAETAKHGTDSFRPFRSKGIFARWFDDSARTPPGFHAGRRFLRRILRYIVKTLENRYPIFKAGEAAGTSMCRVLSMKSTVRPFHGPWGAYAPQG